MTGRADLASIFNTSHSFQEYVRSLYPSVGGGDGVSIGVRRCALTAFGHSFEKHLACSAPIFGSAPPDCVQKQGILRTA